MEIDAASETVREIETEKAGIMYYYIGTNTEGGEYEIGQHC